MNPVDRIINNGELPLATRDFGGVGPAILLIPGAGQTLADFTPMAELLTPSHRVIAMDVRGHGLSGDAPFTWEGAIEDAEAVLAAYGLPDAAVVGHSLGGMIAAKYGAKHPESLGVVNIDGQGVGSPDQYDGLDADTVKVAIAEQLATAMAAVSVEQPVAPAAHVEAAIAGLTTALGLPADLADASVRRTLIEVEGGYLRRVKPATSVEILSLVALLDLPSDYRACKVPLLVFNATAPAAGTPGATEESVTQADAYRRGLRFQLTAMAQELPHLSYAEVEATHALHVTHAPEVCAPILAFLA